MVVIFEALGMLIAVLLILAAGAGAVCTLVFAVLAGVFGSWAWLGGAVIAFLVAWAAIAVCNLPVFRL